MDHLTDRLATLHREPDTPDRDTVDADLIRGHRALRRRNRQLTAGGLALVVVAGGSAYALTRPADRSAPIAGHRTDQGTPTPSPSPSSSPSAEPMPAALKLAPYDGDQLSGYRVTTVPDGWVLQGANAFVLAIARPDDTTPIDSFEGKLVVFLENKRRASHGRPVIVNGRPARLFTQPEGARELFFTDDRGHIVGLQAWADVPLTDQQLIAIANGVTVTRAAKIVEP